MKNPCTFLGAMIFGALLNATIVEAQERPICRPHASPDDWIPDSFAIQACLNTGNRVLVRDGRPGYIVNKELQLLIDYTVLESIEGKATFIADVNLGYDPQWINHGRERMLYADASHYGLANLLFDGNMHNRDPRLHCWEASRRPANIETHGKFYNAHHIDSMRAPCGSNWGIFGEDFDVHDVLSMESGRETYAKVYPFPPYYFNFPLGDGVTVPYCKRGKIRRVTVIDATDFAFLVGGGQQCTVDDVDIRQVNKWAIGGFNIGYMDTGHYIDDDPKKGKADGYHAGSKFTNIRVTSRPNMLGYGISVGSHTFTHGEPNEVMVLDSGTLENASVDGAQVGVLIDGTRRGVIKEDVRARNSRKITTQYGVWYNACQVTADYVAEHFGEGVNGLQMPSGFIRRAIHVGETCPS